ncbi:hypothetical protein C8R45DRAFT_945935 [Mycena sanguinolenta]|nr:hypothetical protein C8R45DRAFT_945935 [Mycena sanguinolenta]
MYVSNFAQIFLLSTTLALRAGADPSSPLIVKGEFDLIQGSTAATPGRLATADDIPTTGPFVPKAANLIVNTTVPQGTFADFGWIFDSVEGVTPGTAVFDGSAFNISMFYTPAGGVEIRISIITGPNIGTGFCGFSSGSFTEALIPSDVLGTYTGRWVIEYGQSTQPDAPVDPDSGCGPLPFTTMNKEFAASILDCFNSRYDGRCTETQKNVEIKKRTTTGRISGKGVRVATALRVYESFLRYQPKESSKCGTDWESRKPVKIERPRIGDVYCPCLTRRCGSFPTGGGPEPGM